MTIPQGTVQNLLFFRQVINFSVATFVFMSGYFVPVEKISRKDFVCKEWIVNRGETVHSLPKYGHYFIVG